MSLLPPLRLGVALGGGAARGLAHLGVLSALHAEGIEPDVIVGTSFGALAGGAVLARHGDVEGVIRDVLAFVEGEQFRRSQLHFFRQRRDIERSGLIYSLKDLVKRGIYYGFSATRVSFIPPEEFRASIDAIVPERAIETLSPRFAAVAADLRTGEEVIVDRGSLRLAVRASCAIPGLMPPVDIGGATCIDGGWVDKVPAEPALALGADVVLAVDVSDDLADTRELTSGLSIIMRGDAIKAHRLKTLQLTRAAMIVRVPVTHVDWADFPRAGEIIDIGRRAMEEEMPRLRSLLREQSSWRRRLARAARRALHGAGLLESRHPEVRTAEALHLPVALRPRRAEGDGSSASS